MATTARKSGSGRFVHVTRRGDTAAERVAEVYRKLDTGACTVDEAIRETANIEKATSFRFRRTAGASKS